MHQIKRDEQTSATNQQPIRVLALASGKGGVGKTCISVNLGIALANSGVKVALLDADMGLSNAPLMLGLHPEQNLADVIHGRCALTDIVMNTPSGLILIPATSGLQDMAELDIQQQASIIRAISELDQCVDILLVDIPGGISDSAVNFSCAAQEVVIVVCDEPASMADAYAFIKLLAQQHQISNFHVISNMVENAEHGITLYQRLCEVSQRYLDISMQYLGPIQYDKEMKLAIRQQQAVVECYPQAVATKNMNAIAARIVDWEHISNPRGCMEFFVERLIRDQRVPNVQARIA
jgi:flagellar biosynthesis protein FlhG